jgi:hypothetical protein
MFFRCLRIMNYDFKNFLFTSQPHTNGMCLFVSLHIILCSFISDTTLLSKGPLELFKYVTRE